MKYQIIILFLFVFLFGCVTIKPTAEDCASCKTGHFIYNMYNNSGIGHWRKITVYMERNDSLQISTYKYPIVDTGVSRITWLGDCKYNLQLFHPVRHIDSLYLKFRPKGNTYTIKKVTADYMLIKLNRKTDTLWRVK